MVSLVTWNNDEDLCPEQQPSSREGQLSQLKKKKHKRGEIEKKNEARITLSGYCQL